MLVEVCEIQSNGPRSIWEGEREWSEGIEVADGEDGCLLNCQISSPYS